MTDTSLTDSSGRSQADLSRAAERLGALPPVVLFDLDDTLLDHRTAVIRAIREHVDALGHPYTSDRFDAVGLWNQLEDDTYHRYLSGELTFAEQRRTRAAEFAAQVGITLDAEQADRWFDDYFERYRDRWLLFNDALPCLAALDDAGIRTGIITNGDPEFQADKLRRIGLGERFEHVCASGAIGISKPDRRIFAEACDRFGVDPADALYVGDRLLTDAVGASDAGLTGVWLNRHGSELPEGALGHGSSSDRHPQDLIREHDVHMITSLEPIRHAVPAA